jgi:hypothetical protein
MRQGDISLLNEPLAQELLVSTIPARLAYAWLDGTPRVVPLWFHWDGKQFVMGSPARAPKLKAIKQNPKVALTIDSNEWPSKVLLVRGTATVEIVPGVAPEYEAAAIRYFGDEQGQGWCDQYGQITSEMGRVAITPEGVGVLDVQTRYPSALSG